MVSSQVLLKVRVMFLEATVLFKIVWGTFLYSPAALDLWQACWPQLCFCLINLTITYWWLSLHIRLKTLYLTPGGVFLNTYIHATILQWTHLVLKHVRFLAVHIVKYFVLNISITANMRNIAYELLYVGLTDIWYGYGFLRNVSCWLKCLPYIYLIVRNYVCSSRNEKVI